MPPDASRARRWRAAFVVVIAVLLFALSARDMQAGDAVVCAGGPPRCATGAAITTQASPAEQLAARYAPIVYLKDQAEPCDADGEPYAPVTVDAVLDNPNVVLRADPADAGVPAPGANGLYEKSEEYYLDLPGSPEKPGCEYETDFRAIAPGLANVAYARVVTESGMHGVALQYWLYYYFNDWNNDHESDWEMIQLVFDAGTVEQALSVAPDHVGYSQHSGGEYAGWESDKLEREGDRPIVYVAAGSHSNQFAQENYLGRAEEGAGYGCDDATAPGTRVELEAILVPATVSGPDDEFAWVTYTGRWGERLRGEFNGPTGPNTKTQWTKPITWDQTKLRDSNVEVPSGRTAGISPANAFCASVAFVSKYLLGVVAAAPWLVPVAAGAFAFGIFVTVRNTDFGLAREPLRRRRELGQILRTAGAIYRHNFGLLFGIALAFVPIGIIVVLLQQLIFVWQPIDTLLDVLATPQLVDAFVAVALGTAVFGLAYIAVVAAVCAAVRKIEDGKGVSSWRAYTELWRLRRALVPARLRALAITIGLAITVVGLPWAAKRAVDWLFIEQAILLDDVPRRQAATRSAEAVRGGWWRAAAIYALLMGIGALTSLIIVTPILLFATGVPLGAVNGISSLIYVLLSPFVALSLVLLYFDLQARAGQRDAAGDQE